MFCKNVCKLGRPGSSSKFGHRKRSTGRDGNGERWTFFRTYCQTPTRLQVCTGQGPGHWETREPAQEVSVQLESIGASPALTSSSSADPSDTRVDTDVSRINKSPPDGQPGKNKILFKINVFQHTIVCFTKG